MKRSTAVCVFTTEIGFSAEAQKSGHDLLLPCIDCKNNYAGVFMKEYIEERAVEIAGYIIEHKATVRQTAKKFGVSKSTIHKDVTDRLLQINPSLAAGGPQGAGRK